LAARYRTIVVQLGNNYQLDLRLTGSLFWLLPGPLPEQPYTCLSSMACLPVADIASLAI